MGKRVYNFKGVAGVEDRVYTEQQFLAIKKVRTSPVEVKLSSIELNKMKQISGLRNEVNKETIVRAFITKILSNEF